MVFRVVLLISIPSSGIALSRAERAEEVSSYVGGHCMIYQRLTVQEYGWYDIFLLVDWVTPGNARPKCFDMLAWRPSRLSILLVVWVTPGNTRLKCR